MGSTVLRSKSDQIFVLSCSRAHYPWAQPGGGRTEVVWTFKVFLFENGISCSCFHRWTDDYNDYLATPDQHPTYHTIPQVFAKRSNIRRKPTWKYCATKKSQKMTRYRLWPTWQLDNIANKIDYLVATNPINVKKEKAGSDKHENRIQYKGEQSFVYLVGACCLPGRKLSRLSYGRTIEKDC